MERPTDFFCEHVKTDNHMAKIKDRLIMEEKKIDAFEKRKNREHNKKFNKQVANVKQQERYYSFKSLKNLSPQYGRCVISISVCIVHKSKITFKSPYTHAHIPPLAPSEKKTPKT